MNKNDRNLHRVIFIDKLKQYCESVGSETKTVLTMIKEFETSITREETKIIELLRMGLNEWAEQDCDYEEYYGRAGCPEFITKRHYRCQGCRAREILKEIEIIEK